jgi:hypothetical protein
VSAIRDVYLPGDHPRPAPAIPAPRTPTPRRRAHGRTGTGHPAQLTVCACQWGPTAHCSQGNHQSCRGPAHTVISPDTYLTYADGTCVMDTGTPVAVWPAGRPCQWTCPCTCHAPGAEPPVLVMPGGWEQPALPI